MTTHLTTQRATLNRYRAQWRAEGRCSQCGREPAPGKTRCQVCIESGRRNARAHLAKRRPHWKALGICVVCGCREAMTGRVWCGVCSERHSERKGVA